MEKRTPHCKLDVVQSLVRAGQVRATRSYADHRVWQDVYRPNTRAGDLYLKLTVIDDLLIVSFKEL
ncbi:mRNA interferase MqsR [Thiorhodovibrio winogradskyi]|uniref:mRNA interferase MqsR n=1 Tax=Thiorhodovibrio winogradskyi TaxID=77007 RepID=A0ABZ0SFC7_9GAMM|nr:type II toxin-antitoxin system MqsR family toxin [Thiorhodovibrio winogradskyi]